MAVEARGNLRNPALSQSAIHNPEAGIPMTQEQRQELLRLIEKGEDLTAYVNGLRPKAVIEED